VTYIGNEELYLELIRKFLNSEIDGETFCCDYFPMWRVDRDEEDIQRASWSERHDLKLIEAYRRDEISLEEFERKWSELFGYSTNRHLVDMLSRIFTACDVFAPVPESDYEIDETGLRGEVGTLFAAYEAERAKR